MNSIARLTSILSVCVVLISSSAFSQQEDARITQMRNAVTTQLQNMLQQEKVARQRYLAEIVEDLQKTCELSKKQRKKLEIAAKGAVEYSLVERRSMANGLADLDVGQLQILNIQFHNDQKPPEFVANEPIWVKTLDRTLTTEQRDTYQTALENRVGAKRLELTDRVMKSLVAFVPMSAEQRAQVAELVSEQLDQTLKDLSMPRAAAMSSQQAMTAVARVPIDKVSEVLNGGQLLQWRNFVRQSQINNAVIQQRRMLGMPNVIQNNVIIKPAQPNGVIVVPEQIIRIPTF